MSWGKWGAVFAALVLSTAQAVLANHEAHERPENTYILGVGKANLFPYFGHCDGEFCGDARKMLDQFASDARITLQFEITPVIRVQDQAQAKHIDAFFPDNAKWLKGAPERSALCFSAPAMPYAEGLLTLNNNANRTAVSSYATLYKWELPPAAAAVLELGTAELYVETTPALVDLLIKKRVDAIYANVGVAQHDLKVAGFSDGLIAPHAAVPLDRDHYVMSGLNGSKLLTLFNDWLNKKTPERAGPVSCP